ncbi:hypothetical protein ABT332_13225 [Saccharomonospora azurea]|uniref:hypothetical protein n=1 Tax=Saccharomonospora azurea TaxID=40988 RepID=UPI00332FE551
MDTRYRSRDPEPVDETYLVKLPPAPTGGRHRRVEDDDTAVMDSVRTPLAPSPDGDGEGEEPAPAPAPTPTPAPNPAPAPRPAPAPEPAPPGWLTRHRHLLYGAASFVAGFVLGFLIAATVPADDTPAERTVTSDVTDEHTAR